MAEKNITWTRGTIGTWYTERLDSIRYRTDIESSDGRVDIRRSLEDDFYARDYKVWIDGQFAGYVAGLARAKAFALAVIRRDEEAVRALGKIMPWWTRMDDNAA